MITRPLIAAATAISLALATTGCGSVPSGTTPISGQSNIAQIAAQALAICQGVCGVIANTATVGDIQALVAAFLGAGAFTTADIIAQAVCSAIKLAKTNGKFKAGVGGQSVVVNSPDGTGHTIHFSGVRK